MRSRTRSAKSIASAAQVSRRSGRLQLAVADAANVIEQSRHRNHDRGVQRPVLAHRQEEHGDEHRKFHHDPGGYHPLLTAGQGILPLV
jgi:hypothetical protein